jgi:hypothetical protein
MRLPQNSETEIEINCVRIHRTQKKMLHKSTFNTSLERNIERLYCKSERFGWSFADFSAHVLEVLIVLQHRKNVKRLAASMQGAGGTIGV